jgi:hypothetical protein
MNGFKGKVFAETATVRDDQDWPLWIVSDGNGNRVAECMDALNWPRAPGQTLICGRELAEKLAANYNSLIGTP